MRDSNNSNKEKDSKDKCLLYSSRKGGFYCSDAGELKYPLIAGYEFNPLMCLVVRALEFKEEDILQRIYVHLLENYIDKDILIAKIK